MSVCCPVCRSCHVSNFHYIVDIIWHKSSFFSLQEPVTSSKMANDVKLLLLISAADQAAEATLKKRYLWADRMRYCFTNQWHTMCVNEQDSNLMYFCLSFTLLFSLYLFAKL